MLLTQLGLSLASPAVICLYAASWLRERFSLGMWIMVIALFLGIASGVLGAWKFWLTVKKRWEHKDSKNSGSVDAEKIGGEKHQD